MRLSRTVPASRVELRIRIAELNRHPELQRMWRDNEGSAAHEGLAEYSAGCAQDGRLDVPAPGRGARQFLLLLGGESGFGSQPLPLRQQRDHGFDPARSPSAIGEQGTRRVPTRREPRPRLPWAFKSPRQGPRPLLIRPGEGRQGGWPRRCLGVERRAGGCVHGE
ncbi:TetR/AcrR family transcriptional regulator C-terminal domain-containing protein [Actinomadura sp. NEAU-AAG7]|nr:TetR/AcrR family transcriptional regulator C-terminal domain-containing protein [Actinomadura sp. NEAU-AAG7]